MATTTAERAVLDKVDEHALVELARSLLRADGQNPPGEEAATVAVLAGAAAELGLDVGGDRAADRRRSRLRADGATSASR